MTTASAQARWHSAAAGLGVQAPLVQAGMGGVAGVELAAAVSNAGALGTVGLYRLPPEACRSTVHAVQARTTATFGVNLIPEVAGRRLLMQQLDAVLDVADRPIVVNIYGVPPEELATSVRCHRHVLLVQLGTVDELLDVDADAVVVQGSEAGGHLLGESPLLELLAVIASRRSDLPVLAAGGIADRRSLVAAMDSGAWGVQVGTAFVVTDESLAHPRYKQLLVAATHADTVITDRFDHGWPGRRHRVLVVDTDESDKRSDSSFIAVDRDARGRRAPIVRGSANVPLRTTEGAVEQMALYSGVGVDEVSGSRPARHIVESLVSAMQPEFGAPRSVSGSTFKETMSTATAFSDPDDPTHLATPFPLSSAQRTLLLDPYISKRVVSCCIEVTAPVESEKILDAFDEVLRIHPGLTTRLIPGPDTSADGTIWLQMPTSVSSRDVVVLRPPSGDPAHVIIRRELDDIRIGNLDPRENLAVRGSITPARDGAILVLAAHHLVMDALSRLLLVSTLDQALRGDITDPTPPAGGIRDMVDREQAACGQPPPDSAVEAVEKVLRGAQPIDVGRTDVPRDQPADLVSIWLSSAEYEAFHRCRARLGATSYTVLLSGFLTELASRSNSACPAVMTVRTRRVGRTLRSLVGTFADGIVIAPPRPIHPEATVESVVQDIGSALFRGLAAKHNLVDLLSSSPSLQRYLAGDLGPVIAFQYLDIASATLPEPGARARLWYRSETEINFDGMGMETLHVICTDHGDSMEIGAWYPPGAFSVDTVQDMLKGFASRAIEPIRPTPTA